MNVPTSIAMALTGMQRLKFNEAVSRGHYRCAPRTDEREQRMFTESDLVALRVFARLLNDGMPPRLAGPLACQVEAVARQSPDILTVYFAKLTNGEQMQIYRNAPGHGRMDVESAQYFDLANIRALLVRDHAAVMDQISKSLDRFRSGAE